MHARTYVWMLQWSGVRKDESINGLSLAPEIDPIAAVDLHVNESWGNDHPFTVLPEAANRVFP